MRTGKRYRCERVRQIGKDMIEVFFKTIDGAHEEYLLINIIAAPGRYEVGKYYWWSDEPAGY